MVGRVVGGDKTMNGYRLMGISQSWSCLIFLVCWITGHRSIHGLILQTLKDLGRYCYGSGARRCLSSLYWAMGLGITEEEGTRDQQWPSSADHPWGWMRSGGGAWGTPSSRDPPASWATPLMEAGLNWLCHPLAPIFLLDVQGFCFCWDILCNRDRGREREGVCMQDCSWC